MDEPFKTHGAFSWCELMTTDAPAAKNFYTKVFGWTTEEMSVTPGMTYTVVKVAGNGIGGIMSMPPGAQGMPPPLEQLCHRRRRGRRCQKRADLSDHLRAA
jgi:predicted enzyme related to lactoylglutathione lyase